MHPRLALVLAAVLLVPLAGCKEEAPICEVAAFPRPQLRLLNAREYRNTVRDLLPATDAACTSDTDCNVTAQSCIGDVCVADPCALHTFVLPSDTDLGTVHVAGDFNGWPATVSDGLMMTWVPDRALYFAKAAIDDGSWQYKFVLNETDWIADPANPTTTPDGFGGNNSVLIQECEGAPPPTDGSVDVTADFPVTARSEGYPFDNDADSGLVTSVHVEQYLAAGAQLADAATADLDALLPCPTTDADCPATWAAGFLRRAYQRPPLQDEIDRTVALVASQPDLRSGLDVAIQVALSSPSFLYRSEIGSEDGDSRLLTQHEIATLLAYTYTGTTPDDALLDAADAGALATPDERATQARRLLSLPAARDVVRAFGVQWLGVEPILTTDKSGSAFPSMTPALRAAMLEETASFMEEVVFDGSGAFEDLLTAPSTPSEALAAHYGSDGARSGILGHGSVLGTYAHSDQTSPVRRGLFVRQRLLCEEFSAPPPDAGGVPDVDPNATTRERFAQHSDNPACAGCHQFIDPVGFGFERFDAVGAYRTTENGDTIDPSGAMVDVEGRGTDTTFDYTSLPELGRILADSEAAPACFARQWFRYQVGHLEDPGAECSVTTLAARLAETDGNILDLLVALSEQPHFVRRSN